MNTRLSEYIKHTRHFDGLGMGDKDLESRADAIQDLLEKVQRERDDLQERVDKLERALREIADEERAFMSNPIGEAGVTQTWNSTTRKAAIARKALEDET